MTPPVTLTARAAGPGREPFLPKGRVAWRPPGHVMDRAPASFAGRVAETTSGWGLGAPGACAEVSPPSPGWSLVRPGEAFHLTAGRVSIAFRAIARVEASIVAAQAAALARIRSRRLFHLLGFSSFADFARERLQTSPRSAARQVALHRVFERAPAVRGAYLAGRVSACQALALAPVAEDRALPFWIELAGSVPVRELIRRVREARREAAGSPAVETSDDEEPGRMVTFAAPRSAAIAWEQGMELARRMLGYEAPRHRCVEAILDETWTDLCAGARGGPAGATEGAEPAGEGAFPDGSTGCAIAPGAGVGSCRTPAVRGGTAPPSEGAPDHGVGPARHPRSLLAPSAERLRDLARALAEVESEVSRVSALIASTGNAPTREDATGTSAGENARGVASSGAAGSPNTGSTFVARDLAARWKALGASERPLRWLKARLLRAAHRAGAVRGLGYQSLAEFVEGALGLSERTGRRFLAETFLFEDEPALARAYLGGEIGLAHAWLIRRVAASDTRTAFLARARRVTALQFEREVRFLQALREFVPSLAAEFAGPLPLPGLEGALIVRLCRLGWGAERVQRALAARQATLDGWRVDEVLGGMKGSEVAAGSPGTEAAWGAEDPAGTEGSAGAKSPEDEKGPPVHPGPARSGLAMRRLEILLELVVLAMEQHDERLKEGVAPVGLRDDGAAETPASSRGDHNSSVEDPLGDETQSPIGRQGPGGDLPTLAGVAGVEMDTMGSSATTISNPGITPVRPAPAPTPNLPTFAHSSALPALSSAAGLDLGGSMATVSFWAPERTLKRWQWAISAVQRGARRLPTWTAAVLLLDAAVEEWSRAGRIRRPAGWRILERDGWRCQVPGCSARKALEVHHIVFRSHGGGDEPGNLVTLCHHHHQHGVHGGATAFPGQARTPVGPGPERGSFAPRTPCNSYEAKPYLMDD